MTIRQRLARSNIFMFLVPLLVAAVLLLLGGGIALYILETAYLPRLGLSLQEMHMTLEQYEAAFSSFEVFLWIYMGAVGTALLLAICFTNLYLTRSLFRHISAPLDELAAGVGRIQRGDLDSPIAYAGADEFKSACDAVDLMAAKLKAALEDEQRRTQSRKELIAGMSHDLKSPLTSIRAYSEALRDGVAATPEMRRRYIETICRKEQEIEGMVNRLFEFSKLDLSELPLDMKTVPLKEAVDAVAADYAAAADIDTGALEGCDVFADENQLKRIVKNIMDNAVKYSGRERVRMEIRAEKNTETLKILFSDDGQGVEEQQLGKLFDVFYRGDPARQRGKDGSGIGLAVVRKAAEEMGGGAEAERSTLGGLCIAVTLKRGESDNEQDPDNRG